MRRLSAILLLVVFSLHAFSRLAVVGHFYLNQKAIAEAYCENKENVRLHCNGCCYLNKQLKKLDAEKTAKRTAPGISEPNEINWFYSLESDIVQPVLFSLARAASSIPELRHISLEKITPPPRV